MATRYRLTTKYDPNQPRHPAGSSEGGQFAEAGGTGGYTESKLLLREVLGLPDSPTTEMGFAATNEAKDAHTFLHPTHYPHQNASSLTTHYQTLGYKTMNLTLRHPKEVAKLIELADKMDERKAWTESGMEAAVGKSLGDTVLWVPDLKGADVKAHALANAITGFAPTLPAGLTLYRSFRPADLLKDPASFVGKTLTEKGFVSTSANAYVVNGWSGSRSTRNTRAVFRFTTKGTEQGLYLGRPNSGAPFEHEVLFAPGTKYRINKITRTNDGHLVVDADIEPPPSRVEKAEATNSGKGGKDVESATPNPEKFGLDEAESAQLLLTVQKYDPSQPRAPAGTGNGGQWVATGGMIPRTAMPQIRDNDLPGFFAFARAQHVEVTTEEVKASSLKFRQGIDPAHAKAMPAAILARSILVSQDNYVLDGNHRAAANAALGNKVTINRVGKPFRESIDLMFAYPGVLNLEQAQEARKFDPGQPRDENGRWTEAGAMQIGPSNPPVPGKAFIAFRVGTEQGDSLAHRNAGDAMGVASYLGNTDDFDKPSFGNPVTHLHVFEVTVDKAFGKYDRVVGGVNQTNNNPDGFVGMDVSPGGVVLSFGSTGYTATRRTSIPVEKVRQYLRDTHTAADTAKNGYSYDGNFDGHGTIRTQEAILALAESELSRKYDPNQPRDENGMWTATGATGMTGFHNSEGSVSDVLGYTRADLVNHPFTGDTNKEAIALHDKIAVEHAAATDNINYVELYQASYYMQINLALRFPEEYATFKGIVYSDVDATEAIDSGAYQSTDSHAYKVASEAFRTSGLQAATGKSLDHFGLADMFEGGGLAETMARDMERHAPTLPKGLKLYRAFRHSDIMNNPSVYVGQTFTEKGFASMTASAHFATKWGAMGTTRLIVRTTTTGKERGVYLARDRGLGPEPYEYEVLLPAGAQFKINGITRTAGRDLVLDATIIQPGVTGQKSDKAETKVPAKPTLPKNPRPERFGWTEEEMSHMFVAQKYDPNQPRNEDGEWTDSSWGGAGSEGGPDLNRIARNARRRVHRERPRLSKDDTKLEDINGLIQSAAGYQNWRDWYKDSYDQLAETFGPKNAEVLALFLAAGSIKNSVKRNTFESLHAYMHYLRGGRFDDDSFKLSGVMGSRKFQYQKVVDKHLVSGPKLEQFAAALKGDLSAVTMDIHMRRMTFGNDKGSGTSAQHVVGQAVWRSVASELNWSARDMQAVVWSMWVAEEGFEGYDTDYSKQLQEQRDLVDTVRKMPEFRYKAESAPGFKPFTLEELAEGYNNALIFLTAMEIYAEEERSQKYDPNQPRAPSGTGIGGQWVSGGGFNASAGSAVFEVAPNPNDKALKERWDKLSDKEKGDVSRKVLDSVIPQVAKELGISKYELVEHVGGWMGDVNPSYTMKALTGAQADAAARLLGHGLKQEGMMLLSNKEFPGSFPAGVVGIGLKGGGSQRASQIYGELSKLKKSDGGFLVQGFTMRGDYMEILHDGSYTGLSDKAFARKVAGNVDKAFDNKYDVHQTTAYASFIGEGDYLNAPQGRLAGGVEDWGRRASRVQSAAQKALEKELGRRGKDDGRVRYTLRVKYDPNQPRDENGRWSDQGAFGFHAFISPGADKGALEQGQFYFAKNPNEGAVPGDLDDTGVDPRQGDLFGDTPGSLIPDDSTLYDEWHGNVVGSDFHDAYSKEHADYRWSKMTKEQQEALGRYQQSEYRNINYSARGGYDNDYIEPLDTLLRDAPGVPQGTVLYRGFRHHDLANSAEDMIGETFTEKGFMSTTVNSHTASQWLDSKDDTDGLVALRLHTTKSTDGLYMSIYDKVAQTIAYEYEVLLPRNTTFKIVGSQRVKLGGYNNTEEDVTVIDAIIVDSDD